MCWKWAWSSGRYVFLSSLVTYDRELRYNFTSYRSCLGETTCYYRYMQIHLILFPIHSTCFVTPFMPMKSRLCLPGHSVVLHFCTWTLSRYYEHLLLYFTQYVPLRYRHSIQYSWVVLPWILNIEHKHSYPRPSNFKSEPSFNDTGSALHWVLDINGWRSSHPIELRNSIEEFNADHKTQIEERARSWFEDRHSKSQQILLQEPRCQGGGCCVHGVMALGCFPGAECRRQNVFAQTRLHCWLTYMCGSIGVLSLTVEIESRGGEMKMEMDVRIWPTADGDPCCILEWCWRDPPG